MKPRIVKDFEKLSQEILALLKLKYPLGFENELITFKNREGKFVSALPFETDDYYYLIRMTTDEAQQIIEEDSDQNEEGYLTEEAKERLEDKIEDETDY